MDGQQMPKVGVGVLVFKDGKILLGKRMNAHGAGQYAGPGGHLEFGESPEECAIRETREETGMEIENPRIIALSNLLWSDRQYIDIGVAADWKSGDPTVCEPEKCEGWDWYDPDYIPENSFGAERFYIEAYKTGKFYFGTKHNL